MPETVYPSFYFSLPNVALHMSGLPVSSEEISLVVMGGEDEVWVDKIHHPLTELAYDNNNTIK